jgi:hypothetical protein
MYYTISCVFISIPGIIVLYSFPTPFVAKRKEEKTPKIRRTILTPQSQTVYRSAECIYHPIVHYIVIVERACEDRSIPNWKKNMSELASQRF